MWEKEKLVITSNFFFSHNVFYPIDDTYFHFKCTLKCRLQFVSIWASLKLCRLVMGKGVLGNLLLTQRNMHQVKFCSFTNSFPTDDDTRSFCGQCRSRSDCTGSAV